VNDHENDITRLLGDVGAGNRAAVNQLFPLVYDELQKMAHRQLRHERAGHTLNTVALVHEAYLKLVDQKQTHWENRGHFFAIASLAMRRILVNYAKMRSREKRGGGVANLPFDEALVAFNDDQAEQIVALDEALERLGSINPRAAKVVECRYFGGLPIEETAQALGIAPMTVKRDWLMAKTWLRREMGEGT
jgi:RNA polymerase sigma-70 factor, ECF subfamily